jgi:hypothetical protein
MRPVFHRLRTFALAKELRHALNIISHTENNLPPNKFPVGQALYSTEPVHIFHIELSVLLVNRPIPAFVSTWKFICKSWRNLERFENRSIDYNFPKSIFKSEQRLRVREDHECF